MKWWRGFGLVVLVSVLGYSLWAFVPDPSICTSQQNAAWVSVDWMSKPIHRQAVENLARSLKQRNIGVIYPYASFFRARDMRFTNSYKYAKEFVATLHRVYPELRVFAWVGVPLKAKRFGGVRGWVELENPAQRLEVVRLTQNLMQQADFAGVHLNVETVTNHDPAYLQLLEEVRAALPADKILSIAANQIVLPLQEWLPVLRDLGWSADYLHQIAQHATQIAVMSYDSNLPWSGFYRTWIRQQAKALSMVLRQTEWFLGISVSKERTRSHQPAVESLEHGLSGFCAADSNATGVAVYADWEWSSAEQMVWEKWMQSAGR
jgi:hypothetical protein